MRRSGQSVLEYGLIIATVAVLTLLGAAAFGTAVAQWFNRLIEIVIVQSCAKSMVPNVLRHS